MICFSLLTNHPLYKSKKILLSLSVVYGFKDFVFSNRTVVIITYSTEKSWVFIKHGVNREGTNSVGNDKYLQL